MLHVGTHSSGTCRTVFPRSRSTRSAQNPRHRAAKPLAFTDCCCHAFRVTGKPFWAFQFHPEVDRKRLVERLTVFKEQYTEGDDHLDEVLSSACETPESNALPRKFVERVLLGE